MMGVLECDLYPIQVEMACAFSPIVSSPGGENCGFVGASGSGKTTAATLIPRFWDVQEGRSALRRPGFSNPRKRN